MTLRNISWILLVAIAVTFTSCEDSFFLPSKKKYKKDLEHPWKRDFLGGQNTFQENWEFKEGNLYLTRIELLTNDTVDNGLPDGSQTDNVDTVDVGTYKVDTKIFNVFVRIGGFATDTALIEYNTKWTVIELDKSGLYFVADGAVSGTVIQREFERLD